MGLSSFFIQLSFVGSIESDSFCDLPECRLSSEGVDHTHFEALNLLLVFLFSMFPEVEYLARNRLRLDVNNFSIGFWTLTWMRYQRICEAHPKQQF